MIIWTGSLGAAESPGRFDAATQFTITRIEPDAAAREVKVRFTEAVPFKVLKAKLKVFPAVEIDWSESSYAEDHVLTLRGEFNYGQRHVLSLPEDLKVGGKLYVRTVNDFVMPDMPPEIKFADPKTVIERDSREMLHLRVQNMERALLLGIRVPPLLLPLAVAASGATDAARWEETLQLLRATADKVNSLVGNHPAYRIYLGTPFEEKQLFFTAGKKNVSRVLSLPLSFRKDKEHGALELIRVTENDAAPTTESPAQVFRITDIGLTYKLSRQNLLVWTTSLKTGTPKKGVALLAVTRNLEAVPIGKTGEDGVFIFRPRELEGVLVKSASRVVAVKKRLELENITFVVAVQDKDVSFIEVKPSGDIAPRGVEQASPGPTAQRLLKRNVFTERGIYRPGDTVHFKGTAREYLDQHIVAPRAEECVFEISDARGEKVFASTEKLSAYGSAFGQMVVKPYFPLGTYTLTMHFGPEKGDSTNCTFEVQEYRPPRHFTELSFSRETRRDESIVNQPRDIELLRIDIVGSYYAGGPVKHGQVRWRVFHAKTDHAVKGYDGFTFGYQREEERDLLESGEAVLDEKGQVQVEFPLDRDVLSGKFGLEVVASVIDFDGRAASSSRNYQVTPELLVGISRHPVSANTEETHSLNLVVVDKQGRRVQQGKLEAAVLKRGSTYLRKRNEQGELYGQYSEVWRKVCGADLAIKKGAASFPFDFGWGGDYLLSFTYRDESGRAFTSATRYDVNGGYDSYEEESPEKAYESLGLYAEKEFYRPGETAKVLFSPRRAVSSYLMTVEQDGVLQHRVLPGNVGQRSVDLPVRADYAPNVYVSLLGVTPRSGFQVYARRYDEGAPNFLFGAVNLEVRTDPKHLKVVIGEGAEKIQAQPGASVKLDFLVGDAAGHPLAAELAVGVVDESVLALTKYATPSLDDLGRFDVPLGVFTGELRTQLLHQTPFDLVKNVPVTGGDGGEDGTATTGKVRRRFDPVAYFNPAVLTDSSGHAQVSFTLPDTMTTYRIYVVGCDQGALFGNAQRALQAVKKFYLEPGLPSFFTLGDQFKFAVSAFTSLDRSGQVEFHTAINGGLKLTTDRSNYPLAARDSTKIPVSGQATAVGKATATFSGAFQGEQDAVEVTVPVNSNTVQGTEVAYGTVTRSAELRTPLAEVVTTTDWDQVSGGPLSCRLTLAGTPFLRMASGIHYLLHYPYGCVEQTSSGVMPLAALRGLIQDGRIPEVTAAEVDRFLARGVERLFSMQTSSGGFGYWPGYTTAHPWGTIYAAAALSIAKASGYPIPAERLTKALDFLKKQLKQGGADSDYRAFVAYVLALNGALDEATLKEIFQEVDAPSRQAELLLVLAAKQSSLLGQPELVEKTKALLAMSGSEPTPDEFQARYREPALALLAANAVLPGDPLTEAAAQRLLGGVNQYGIWSSTSDTGWSLLALGEYYRGQSLNLAPVKVSVHQEKSETQILDVPAKGFRTIDLGVRTFLKNPVLWVETSSDQPLYYKLEVTFPRVDYAAGGNAKGFRVWKTIENSDGSDQIHLGDVVKVTVQVEATEPAARYVVLDDPLPAGLVAINSVLKTEEPVEGASRDEYDALYWTPDGAFQFAPDFFEIRDDRVVAFRERLWKGRYQFSYYARAVCAGTFVMPSTKMQMMYAPETNGYTPASRVVIEAR